MYDGKYPDNMLGDVVIVLKFKMKEKFLKKTFLSSAKLGVQTPSRKSWQLLAAVCGSL